ncbi:hypothetical protein ACFP56_15740 [Paenibacillus septentrionalis]|uniref:DUF1700 domain-containing protein n=1 Tax=Paenibacillus septentrionalis TaxID=429342 RepID=A0ABW1V621_9BACL
MPKQEVSDRYLRSLEYYIWISELSPERKQELYAEYKMRIEEKSNSNVSLQELRSFLVESGNPKDIVKKEMKGIESSLAPTAGTFKRSMGFMPFIFTIGWTLNSDLYQQLGAGELQPSFWLHSSIILLLLIGTVVSFYKYRFDQSFFKEVAISNFVVYLPISFIFCYMLLDQFTMSALLIPFILIVVTTGVALYFDWKNSSYLRKLFIP